MTTEHATPHSAESFRLLMDRITKLEAENAAYRAALALDNQEAPEPGDVLEQLLGIADRLAGSPEHDDQIIAGVLYTIGLCQITRRMPALLLALDPIVSQHRHLLERVKAERGQR